MQNTHKNVLFLFFFKDLFFCVVTIQVPMAMAGCFSRATMTGGPLAQVCQGGTAVVDGEPTFLTATAAGPESSMLAATIESGRRQDGDEADVAAATRAPATLHTFSRDY